MRGTYDVSEHGAVGVARPGPRLVLDSDGFRWLRQRPGTTVAIRVAEPGRELDSLGIQRAIDAAHAAGGGTVVVPPGDYLIGPLVLRSRIRLHLEAGARLWGSPERADYLRRDDPLDVVADPDAAAAWPPRPPRPGSPRNLISADDAEDVAITGMGEIHGQSPAWAIPWHNSRPDSWKSLDRLRPGGACIRFGGCRRVLVEGVRIQDSPSWTLVFSRCAGVRVQGIRIRNFDVINADGIDIVDSSDVIVTGCDLHVTDDGICLKSDPADPHAPGVRNVVIGDCIVRSWCNGVKIGTEGASVFADIAVSNLVLHVPEDDLKWMEGGINLCACDGSVVRNVNISGIVMRRVESPFYLVGMRRERHQAAWRTPRAGTIDGVTIADLRVDGFRYTPFVVGHPERPIRDIRIAEVALRKGDDHADAVRSRPWPGPVPPVAGQYPTGFMFGSSEGGTRDVGDGLPAHGLYLRDAEQIAIRSLRVTGKRADGRPLLAHEACRDVVAEECRSLVLPDG